MFNLSRYQKSQSHLSDLLPWAAIIVPGIILNKDGSFQCTLRFRGQDLESSTDEKMVSVSAKINNAMKRFGSGWVIYVESARKNYELYKEGSYFQDELSLLIDSERRERFSNTNENFESKYYLTLQFLPPFQSINKFKNLFFLNATCKEMDYRKSLDFFINCVKNFADILKDVMFELEFLNDDETLTYLHSAISTKAHDVKTPENPMYLDSFLADTPIFGGLNMKLGDNYLCTISILTFPIFTFPSILSQLDKLPFNYRFVTRFIALDKKDAEEELKKYRRCWFAKRKGLFQIVNEVFTKGERGGLYDTYAVEKSRDADIAIHELSEDYVSYGYYTATMTVSDKNLERVKAMQFELERVINGFGFTTIAETFNSLDAWLSSLPGHAYANVRKSLINSLNLSHLIPFSAVWSGKEKDEHLNAPPLMYVHTHGRTPFRLVNHIGDVGHQMIIGPTGSGKSVLLTMLALQFLRYKNAQVFIFDKGESFLAATLGVKGCFYDLGDCDSNMHFQVLANIDNHQEKIWALEWLCELFKHENVVVTKEMKVEILDALDSLASILEKNASITSLYALIQDKDLRKALLPYTLCGPFGYIFDGDSDGLCLDKRWHCYEIEKLMDMKSIISPLLSYLFHRIEKYFNGDPTLLILDEAWTFLDNDIFASKIKDWLKRLRKRNVSVIFATQSAEDALNTVISPVLLESCPSRIFLPNDRILEPKIKSSYEKFGLNDKQLDILATATPKKQYYYQSSIGNRLFNLELGEVAMAFSASSNIEARLNIKRILKEGGSEWFLQNYLTFCGTS